MKPSRRSITMAWLALIFLAFAAPSVAQTFTTQSCGIHHIGLEAFRNRSDIPFPSTSLPTTLPSHDVPIPPNAVNGLRSNKTHESSIGFSFKGAFFTSGAGTSDNFSHQAIFWHDDIYPNFNYNGFEYGFINRLQNGRVDFYLCGYCNTADQEWKEETVVWAYRNGTPFNYSVRVTETGDFAVTITKLDDGSIETDMVISRPWWMPNLYGTEGMVTALWQGRRNHPDFHDSYFQLNEILIVQPDCKLYPK